MPHALLTSPRTLLNLLRYYLLRFNRSSGCRPDIPAAADIPETLLFPPVAAPLVSIVIPAHNQWPMTHACLYSILRHSAGVPYEVIVADDCSDDETRTMEERLQTIRVVRNEVNLHFLRSCNRAAAVATGTYLLLLNNDTCVQPGWLEALVATAEADPTVGIVGAKLLFADGRLQEAGGIVWRDAAPWNYGRWDDPEKPRYNRVRDADYVSGACLLIRRELWQKIGGFDERYAPAYYEDTDLAFEVRRRGYRVVYQPAAVVVHYEGASCGRDPERGTKRYQKMNEQKFFDKWHEVLQREHPSMGERLPEW
jgi:GT2 family glycosyltransferase